MIASLQWSGCYQEQCEGFLRQLDCSCFGYTSSQLAGTLLIDLGTDLQGVETSCGGDELDLYVDLPFSPLQDTGNIDAQNEGWNGTLSMEEGRISAVDQRAGSASASFGYMDQGRMYGDGLTCVHGSESTFDKKRDEDVISKSDTHYIGPHDADKRSVSEEKPHRRRFSGSNRVVSASDQNLVEVRKSYQLPSLPQSSNECIHDLSQNNSEKRLGKRACGVPEIENSKRRKVSEPVRICGSKNECQSSVLVVEKSKNSLRQWQREASKLRIEGGETVIRSGKRGLLDVKCPHKSQPSFIHEDISREEAAVELQQCVSLLRKHGVLKNRDFYTSQNLQNCVLHPGFVGDGQQSKVCKTCGAVEDANGTVICDECQESFHLSCCLPRMSSKYFDREDNWYCNSCKKQKKKIGSKFSTEGFGNFNSFKLSRMGLVDGSGPSAGASYNSKVRLGSAHQANVPTWTGNVEVNDPMLAGAANCLGMEVPVSQEEKDAEKNLILETFKNKVQALNWILAKMLPNGMPENWLQCQNVLQRAFKDSDGQKHSEVLCGKWRRAPLDCKQTDSWECFCVIEWDPLHADCAIPQELSTEEILKRIQTKVGDQAPEVFLSKQNI